MSISNGFSKTLMFGALALACGALYSVPASAAVVPRSFYQNSGVTCRGIDAVNDSKLTRTANRLINNTSSSVDVVCNLPVDIYADQGANGGVVTYVALWVRRITGGSVTMTCTLTDGFYGQSGSTITSASTTLNSGAQGILEWTPSGSDRFLGPVNIRCSMPAKTELDEWFVEYLIDNAAH